MNRNMTAALMLAGAGVLGVTGLAAASNTGAEADEAVSAVTAPEPGTVAGSGWGHGNGGGGRGNGAGQGYGGGQGTQGSGTGMHGQGSGQATHEAAIPAAVPGATISDAVEAQLVFMVQEEKLARDVYTLAMGEYPDARVFTNISRAESTHMAEVQVMLERYDVVDPTVGLESGKFVDDSLQALYDSLADEVKKSWEQAVQAGVAVEVTDIEDLEAAMKEEAPADVTAVLENLLAGSQRHLAAFQRNGGTVTDA